MLALTSKTVYDLKCYRYSIYIWNALNNLTYNIATERDLSIKVMISKLQQVCGTLKRTLMEVPNANNIQIVQGGSRSGYTR